MLLGLVALDAGVDPSSDVDVRRVRCSYGKDHSRGGVMSRDSEGKKVSLGRAIPPF